MKKHREGWGCIYLLTNKKNGKRYVGKDSTGDPENHRWKNHINIALNTKDPRPLYCAIRKAGGPEGFTAEIIWRGSNVCLNKKETYYIRKRHSFINDPLGDRSYNLTLGGDGGDATVYMTKKRLAEYKATCSAAHIERYKDPRAHEVQREGNARRFADPTKRAENAAAHRTPEFVASQSERGKKKWRNKRWREDWIAANTTPEAHEKKSRIGKDWHADPAAQARFLSGVKSTACSERHSTSGIKWYSVPKNHKKHLATHRTPEFRALNSANTKAFWDTMTPEERSIWWREVRAAKLKKK